MKKEEEGNGYAPCSDGEAVCPSKTGVERIREAEEDVGVVPEVVLLDEAFPGERVFGGVFVLAQAGGVDELDEGRVLGGLGGVGEALDEFPFCKSNHNNRLAC